MSKNFRRSSYWPLTAGTDDLAIRLRYCCAPVRTVVDVVHVRARDWGLVTVDDLQVVGQLGCCLGEIGELSELGHPVMADGRHLHIAHVVDYQLGAGQEPRPSSDSRRVPVALQIQAHRGGGPFR